MKRFKFEITLLETDLAGDEFWETAIKEDGTGISDLTKFLETMIFDSNILAGSIQEPKDVIKLIEYNDI